MFRSIVRTIESRKDIGAVWFAAIAAVSSISVWLAYRIGGTNWVKYGEFREIATGLALVCLVYVYRYILFPSGLAAKTRRPGVFRVFFSIAALFVLAALIFIYPGTDDNYNAGAYAWYGVYLAAIVGLIFSYGCEVCWSLFRHQMELAGRLCKSISDKDSIEQLLPNCSAIRKEINSDCIKVMYGIITAAFFVLFVSRTTYLSYAKTLHVLFLFILIVLCLYPFLKIIRIMGMIKRKKINELKKLILDLDAKILARYDRNEPVDKLEDYRSKLEKSKERLEEKEMLTKIERHMSFAVLIFGIVSQAAAWTGLDKVVGKFIRQAVGRLF